MQKRILIAPLVFLGLIAACQNDAGQVKGTSNTDQGQNDSGTGISLTPGTPGSCVEETCLCPDGQIGKAPCVEAKIFHARTARQYKEVASAKCECPPQRPDGGAPDALVMSTPDTRTPDATIPEPPVPDSVQPDAGLPVVCEPYRTYTCGFACPNGLRPEATCNTTGHGFIKHENAIDGVCVCPPNIDAAIDAPLPPVTPDAKIATTPDALIKVDLAPKPDTYIPVVVVAPDASPDLGRDKTPDTYVPPPVVATPDAMPDLRPDTTPDTTPTPDAEIQIDTFVSVDTTPDTKPDCGCTEKRDTVPACWHGTPWTGDITLTLETCGGVKVEWKPEDCSTNGFKVVWIRYTVDEDGNVDLPSYPNHADGYQYVGNVTQYTIDGLDSGKWTIRVYKYPTGGGGTEGKYSAPEFVTVP